MQTNQSRAHTSNYFLFQALVLQTTVPLALITPRPGIRQLGTTPIPQSPLKLFKLASPEPIYHATLVLSFGIHNKGSCPHFPLAASASWMTLLLPCVALCGMLCLLFLGICEYKHLLHDSHFCVCLSYHTWLNKSQVSLKQSPRIELKHRTMNLVNQKHKSDKKWILNQCRNQLSEYRCKVKLRRGPGLN